MTTYKQDMPPIGGFKSVQYERIPLKKYLPASLKWLGAVAVVGYGYYSYIEEKDRVRWDVIERRSAYFSVLPLLMAEYDRSRLKIFRQFRDEEAEIMKDVEGWKVGTYKGEPIYKTVKPNEWYDSRGVEPWVYAKPKDYRALRKLANNN